MADIVPVTYTTYNIGISHARAAGERYALCGVYVWIRTTSPETLVPAMPLCEGCLRGASTRGITVPGAVSVPISPRSTVSYEPHIPNTDGRLGRCACELPDTGPWHLTHGAQATDGSAK